MTDTTLNAPALRKRRGWFRKLVWVAGIVIILLVVVYFVATSGAFFKGVILPRVSKAINADITVSDASISPFREVVLQNLRVQTTGAEPLLTAREVRARYSLMDILGGHIHVEEVVLSSATVIVVENPDKSSNLDPVMRSQPGKAKEPAAKSAKPAQIDIRKVALTDATVRKVRVYKNGNRDVTELSRMNITLDDLKNGQSGKLGLSADITVENNPPAPGASGLLQGKLNGSFGFTLTGDLKPSGVKGNIHLEVSRAEGALAELTALVADLDCEVTPTDIKEVALHFQKNGTRLGEVRVSGPFTLEKKEGRLALAILSIDKQLLNLFGARSGIDFGTTTLNSTNEIQIAKDGLLITTVGQLEVGKFQVRSAQETTPVLDLRANYDVTVDLAQKQKTQSITGNLVLADFTGRLGKNEFRSFGATMDFDVSVRQQVAEVRQFQITLTPTSRAKNELQLSGQVDMSRTNAIQGKLKLAADSLDVTSYYDLFAGEKKTSGAASERGGTKSTSAPPAAEKEPEAMQLPFGNFAVEANIRRLYLHEVEIADWQTTVKLDGSRVELNPCKLTLNGAPADLTLDLDLGVPGYKYDAACNAQRIPLAPLMNSFQPGRKGQVSGTLTAQARVSGAGVTGASLQKNLAGQFDVNSTNLNLSMGNIKNPMLKTLVNVVSLIPELMSNPVSTASLLLQGLTGKAGSSGGLADGLQRSPVNAILARGKVGAGRVDLQQAVVQSAAFEADAQGTISLAAVMTNSTLQIPVSVSLSRSLAQRMNLVPANTPTNAAYAKLPDFLTMKGTVGKPEPEVNKLALAGTVLQGIGGSISGSGGLLQGLGGILTGSGSAATNTPASARTNQPATNQSPVNDLIDGLFGPKKK